MDAGSGVAGAGRRILVLQPPDKERCERGGKSFPGQGTVDGPGAACRVLSGTSIDDFSLCGDAVGLGACPGCRCGRGDSFRGGTESGRFRLPDGTGGRKPGISGRGPRHFRVEAEGGSGSGLAAGCAGGRRCRSYGCRQFPGICGDGIRGTAAQFRGCRRGRLLCDSLRGCRRSGNCVPVPECEPPGEGGGRMPGDSGFCLAGKNVSHLSGGNGLACGNFSACLFFRTDSGLGADQAQGADSFGAGGDCSGGGMRGSSGGKSAACRGDLRNAGQRLRRSVGISRGASVGNCQRL